MTEVIHEFTTRSPSGGYQHTFLSNFYPSPITWQGKTWPDVETAFQASKTTSEEDQEAIRRCGDPGVAKKMGRKLTLRDGWDSDVKFTVMAMLLGRKFIDPGMANCLLATGDAILVEGNTWGDRIWGATAWVPSDRNQGRDGHEQIDHTWPLTDGSSLYGRNQLGRNLMVIRDRLMLEWLHD